MNVPIGADAKAQAFAVGGKLRIRFELGGPGQLLQPAAGNFPHEHIAIAHEGSPLAGTIINGRRIRGRRILGPEQKVF